MAPNSRLIFCEWGSLTPGDRAWWERSQGNLFRVLVVAQAPDNDCEGIDYAFCLLDGRIIRASTFDLYDTLRCYVEMTAYAKSEPPF